MSGHVHRTHSLGPLGIHLQKRESQELTDGVEERISDLRGNKEVFKFGPQSMGKLVYVCECMQVCVVGGRIVVVVIPTISLLKFRARNM